MSQPKIDIREPSTSQIDYAARVKKAWGDEWFKHETAYEFSNGRKFETSTPTGGPYGNSAAWPD